MFIHPVNVIIFLSIVALSSLAWIIFTGRRERRLMSRAVEMPHDGEALRERVAVLERIASYPAVKLYREIENLRSAC